jgi:hypothetical protein
MTISLNDIEGLQLPEVGINESTLKARETTTLSPRFYTTNFEELDRTDVSAVRAQWDELLAELAADKRGNNPDICELFKLHEPRRGAARRLHQRRAARGFGVAVNLAS